MSLQVVSHLNALTISTQSPHCHITASPAYALGLPRFEVSVHNRWRMTVKKIDSLTNLSEQKLELGSRAKQICLPLTSTSTSKLPTLWGLNCHLGLRPQSQWSTGLRTLWPARCLQHLSAQRTDAPCVGDGVVSRQA